MLMLFCFQQNYGKELCPQDCQLRSQGIQNIFIKFYFGEETLLEAIVQPANYCHFHEYE